MTEVFYTKSFFNIDFHTVSCVVEHYINECGIEDNLVHRVSVIDTGRVENKRDRVSDIINLFKKNDL